MMAEQRQRAIVRSSSESDTHSQGNASDHNQLLFKSSSFALLRAKHGLSPRQSTIDNAYIIGAKRVLDFMYNLWQKNRLCDVDITTGSQQTLHAHKIAIGAYSDSLCERFNQQPPGTVCHLQLPNFDSKTISSILRFFYTTDIELNDNVIDPTLGCSLEMGVDTIILLCKDYLCRYTLETSLLYHSIAEKYDLVDIEQRIYDFICENYSKITKTKAYLNSHLRLVRKLSNEDRLLVATELEVFLAVVAWVDHDRQGRLAYAPGLVACVRMQLISPELLVTQVETVDHIISMPQCQRQLYNAIKYHALKLSGSMLSESFPIQTPRGAGQRRSVETSHNVNAIEHGKGQEAAMNMYYTTTEKAEAATIPEREPARGRQGASIGPPASRYIVTASGYNINQTSQFNLVAVGGIDLQNVDSDTPGRCVSSLDPSTKRWTPLTTLGQYTHHHGVVALGSTIYVIGGAVYDPTDPERLGGATHASYAYNGRTGKWRRLADMHQARAYLAVAAYNGSIFAVGGEDESRRKLDSVECYDVLSDHWSLVARMPRGGKIGMSAATWRDMLYIVGGYTRERPGNPVLDDVECLDLQRQRWIPRRPLDVPRCHASLVVARGRLYLVGGRTKLEGPPPTIASLSNINVYDERNDTWRRVAELAVSRHDAGSAVIGSKIFIVGGMRTPSPYCLSSVECYDVTTGRWEENAGNLPYNTSGVACCALVSTI